MFFKSKKKISTEEVAQKLAEKAAAAKAELKEELDGAVVPELKTEAKAEETVDAPVAAEGETATDVQLFPGLDDQDFEVGYASFASADFGMDEAAPRLVMRWKTGKGEWFPIPAMFNKVVLDCIHGREATLDDLLSDYGYQPAEARPSDTKDA